MTRFDPMLAEMAEHYGLDAVDETQASDERAALVERMARRIQSAVRKEVTMDVLRQDVLAAEAALAAVEAAGWRPPSAPLTGADVAAIQADAAAFVDEWIAGEYSEIEAESIAAVAALAVLRHPLLAARGVRLEGEQG